MKEKFSGFAVIAFLVSQCIACATTMSVNEVFQNRKSINGKIINVMGVLENQNGVIKICQDFLNEDCINLEYSMEHINRLKANVGKKILLEGIYKEHEYVENDEDLNFIPSRISVLSFLPNNIGT